MMANLDEANIEGGILDVRSTDFWVPYGFLRSKVWRQVWSSLARTLEIRHRHLEQFGRDSGLIGGSLSRPVGRRRLCSTK